MNEDMRRVKQAISVVMGTLSQVGDNQLPDDNKFVGEGFSFTNEQIENLSEQDPLKFMEKALFEAYYFSRKLAERR